MSIEKQDQAPPSLPQVQPQAVPVFNCHVILSQDASGTIQGRVANLPSVSATGTAERDVLLKIVADFKSCLKDFSLRQEEVPWQEPADQPGPDEVERWIPVHL